MRPHDTAAIEPVPPTLRDGEPRKAPVSGVVPKGEAGPVSVAVRRPMAFEVEALSGAATQAFARGEVGAAHRAARDALELLRLIGEVPGLARAELAVGRCLVGLGEPHRALGVLDAAERHADETGDLRTRGRALQLLGQALWAMGDAACRAAFEDAGSIFEDLGDEAAMRSIDAILRDVALIVEESPRSFAHANERRAHAAKR